MKRIFLIDCPGIVPPNAKDTEADILFRGVVRVEHVSHPEQFIPVLLEKCKPQHLERTYEVSGWKNATEFLELIARKHGRLLKGGEPDESGVAKLVLNDFNRGKIPWFVPPPFDDDEDKDSNGLQARAGRLGEMRKRSKRTDDDDSQQKAESKKTKTAASDEEAEEWTGLSQ
ncbi:putative GTPase NOG2 [Sugiyamaella lignohabitans]|uniref:Putative GTPase NOG2 n=1 Tax=Sugiyamaella lignohabitans TaxID=796027 RepID=A0A161HGD5_9ASCO|nr:putative GTPase NOG2 [Sugiyamaella lignohabitans]ANB14780.1 putative GTPase NOG2 [Sugiyamaella lignohabitans]